MKKDEYISVSEFAELAGVSVQSIYKKFSTQFKQVEGRKMLKKSLLREYGLNQTLNQIESGLNTDEPILRTIAMLEKELAIKNKQIEDYADRLKESHILIGRQQELQAIEKKEAPAELPKTPDSLLNREKFSTEAEYQQFLLKLLPRIGLFSNRFDLKELEKVLEMMSEYERKLIFRDKRAKEAIERIRGVDFDQQEKDLEEVKKETEEFRKMTEKATKEIWEQMQKERAERLNNMS